MWIFRAFWQVLPTAPPSCCHSKAAGTPPPRGPLVLAAWWLHRDPLLAQRTSTAQTLGIRLSLSSRPKDSPTWGKRGWSRPTGYPHWMACLFMQTWLCGACSPSWQVPVGRVSLQLCSLAPWVRGHVPVIPETSAQLYPPSSSSWGHLLHKTVTPSPAPLTHQGVEEQGEAGGHEAQRWAPKDDAQDMLPVESPVGGALYLGVQEVGEVERIHNDQRLWEREAAGHRQRPLVSNPQPPTSTDRSRMCVRLSTR